MDENNISKATQKEMIYYFKRSRQTISNALKDLEELSFIEKSKYGTFNVYHINENIFRKVKGQKKMTKYYRFISQEEFNTLKKIKPS